MYDSRVSFWEPAKWVAKTRQLTTGHPVILLLTQMAAGHAGVSGVFSQLRETALEQAFLLRATCAAAQPLSQVNRSQLMLPCCVWVPHLLTQIAMEHADSRACCRIECCS